MSQKPQKICNTGILSQLMLPLCLYLYRTPVTKMFVLRILILREIFYRPSLLHFKLHCNLEIPPQRFKFVITL